MSFRFNPFTNSFDRVEDSGAASTNVTRSAGENISSLKLVYVNASDEFMIAGPDTFSEATVVGVAINGGSTGQPIEAQTRGEFSDPFFTFPVNAQLYLGANGTITDTFNGSHRVRVGYSLGPGKIFIEIGEPRVIE